MRVGGRSELWTDSRLARSRVNVRFLASNLKEMLAILIMTMVKPIEGIPEQ